VSAPTWLAVTLVLLIGGCGAVDAPPVAPSTLGPPWTERPCPATHASVGPACVPQFDDCGATAVPRLGGGCTAIGVELCPKGFAADGTGGCKVVLPAATCGASELALPGDATCAPIGDCGWSAPSSALRVDAAASEGGDGSTARPFRTIAAALAAAKDGDTLALAEGTYVEDVSIDRRVTLHGVCPEKTLIRGVSSADGAAAILVRADATIAGLAITGPARGVMVDGANASLSELHVHDTGELGIGARAVGRTVTIRRVSIERVRDAGIASNGGTLSVDDAVIRDVTDGPGAVSGYGIYAGGSSSTKSTGEARVRRVIVERAGAGIVTLGATLTVAEAWVHDLAGAEAVGIGMPHAAPLPSKISIDGAVIEDTASNGIAAIEAPLEVRTTTVRRTKASGIYAFGTTAAIASSMVRDATGRGVSIDGSSATVGRTIVTDTRATSGQGCGACAAADPSTGKRLELVDVILRGNAIGGVGVDGVTLVVDGARLENNGRLGVSASGTDATLSRVIISHTRPDDAGLRGDGILLASSAARVARLVLSDAWIERSAGVGVLVLGEARIERTIVRDTHPLVNNGANGVGIVLAPPTLSPRAPKGTLLDVLIERSDLAGLFVGSGTVDVARSVVRDTRASGAGLYGDGIVVSAQSLTLDGSPVPSTAVLDESLVEGSARAGISVFGSTLRLGRTKLSCNGLALDIEEAFGPGPSERHPITLTETGPTECGCGPNREVCRGISTGLGPIPATPPA